MTELEPLFDGCDDFERALLRSTRADAPPRAALPKTLAALGVGASALATSAGAGAVSAASASSLSAWTVLKALGVGALAGGVASAVATNVTREPPRVTTRAPLSTSALHVPAASASAPRRDLGLAPESSEPESEPLSGAPRDTRAGTRAEPGPAVVNHAPAAPASPSALPGATPSAEPAHGPQGATDTPSAASIAEEVKTLDRARQALTGGRARDALSEANAYIARWPNGSLGIEAAIVRVEAELALGDRGSAERDARKLIAMYPASRYALRVSALFVPPLSE